jgi:hypothetical protein
MFTGAMNPLDLTVNQLKRAAAIKERIEALNKEFRAILGEPSKPGPASPRKRSISDSVRKKIAAAQRARWAKLRGSKPTTVSTQPAATAKTKTMSAAARARLSAKLKAYWAAKKKRGQR